MIATFWSTTKHCVKKIHLPSTPALKAVLRAGSETRKQSALKATVRLNQIFPHCETLKVLRLCALSLNLRSLAPLVQLKVALATATRTAIEMQPSCQEERGPGLSWLCGGNHCATPPLQSSGKSDLSFTESSKHGIWSTPSNPM